MKQFIKQRWILILFTLFCTFAWAVADRIERGGLDVKGNLTVRGTSTLTGAIASPTLTTPTIDISLWDDQGSTPSTPSSGIYKAYFKTDGKFYKLNSSGTETEIGSGSGAGGTNDMREYITNGKFETDTTGWSTYADAAASAPVNCTAGSPNITGTRTTTAGEVIRETASYELAKGAANRQGEGVSYDFTLDYNDYNNLRGVPISFEYNTTANFASGDILVYVYDVDAASTPVAVGTLQSTTAGTVNASTAGTRWNGIFYPAVVTSDNYRLCLHVATTNATAYDFHLDSVHIGNQNVAPGAINAYLGALTTTGTWTSGATYAGKYWREGDFLVGQVVITASGAVTATGLNLTLPSSLTIDTAKLGQSTSAMKIEGGWRCDNPADNVYEGTMAYSSTTAVGTWRPITKDGNAFSELYYGNQLTNTAPFTIGASDTCSIWYRVPISNWATSAALSTTETLFSTATVGASGDAASATVGNPIIFPTETYDVFSAYDNSTGRFTAPKSAKYRVFGALGSASSATTLSVYVNAVSRALAGNLDSNGEATFAATVSVSKGDLIDLRPGGTVDATTSSFFIEEIPDFSIFSVYGISDYSSSTSSTTNLPTSTQYGDLTSLTLPPGEWDIGVNAVFHRNTASEAAFTACNIGVSTTSGNSTSGLTLGVNWTQASQTFGFGSNFPMHVTGYRVTPTVSTTYYLKFGGTYASNQPQADGTIYARRIK